MDASNEKVCFLYHGDIITVSEYEFTLTEQNYSSAHRELLALFSFLTYCKDMNQKFSSPFIFWQTDNSAVYYFLTKGSRNLEIQNTILKIKYLELELNHQRS